MTPMTTVASMIGKSRDPAPMVDVDAKLWPHVVCTFPGEPLTDAGIEALIGRFFSMLRRRQKYLIVMDCLAVDHMVDARQRAAFGDFVMNPEARARRRSRSLTSC